MNDPSLLQGLQRMLRSKRTDWDMTFAAGGRQALELMEKQCFHVVVADMRMPEIDGAELLSRVRGICPRSVRIILSGQAELQTIMKAIKSTHQYLSKPCDPEVLKATIDRASRLRKLMKNEGLEEFISQLDGIPSQPDLYDEVVSEINTEKPSTDKICSAIARDIGMAAKILQLVNSSFFGPKREVLNIHEAVGILGIDLLRELILSHKVFARCDAGHFTRLRLEQINKHSISVANFALRIAAIENLDRTQAEVCLTTGLLHDIGKIILYLYAPAKYQEVLALGDLGEESQAWAQKEIGLFSTTHSEVGGYLLGLWGLPSLIVDAASHHRESIGEQQDLTILSAIQIANQLASATSSSGSERLESSAKLNYYRERLKKGGVEFPGTSNL